MSQVETLRASEPKLIDMITSADEDTLPALLEVNDQVQAALREYEYVAENGPRPKAAPVDAKGATASAGAFQECPVVQTPAHCAHTTRTTQCRAHA